MEFVPIKTPQCGSNQTTVDDLLREFFRLGKNGKSSSIASLLQNEPSVNLGLIDFYKDIQSYKHELEEIKKAHESVACLQNSNENFCNDNGIDLLSGDKYFLIQPETVIPEKSASLNLHPQECPKEEKKELIRVLSESTVSSTSLSNDGTKSPIKPTKITLRIAPPRKILLAQPEIIEFHNCEAHAVYLKKIILRNVDTQLTRFQMECRPADSPFRICVENNRDLIAPGMCAKVYVQYKCDGLSEPEERLVINVPNGQTVMIMIKVSRDPPVLQVLAQSCSTLSLCEKSSESSLSSSTLESSSNESFSGSPSFTENSSDSTVDYQSPKQSSFDCKKCFVGEFVMISTLIKNNGGKGRFFIMSETDWCLLKIKDITMENLLIVPPFAMWPAYFVLEPDELLILYTYFFPETYGLQVDELYVISDNCSVKTIEVIGDGIVFDRQSLEFNNNVNYQWFQMKNKELCMMRYMDLGTADNNTFLGATFTMTSKCDLDVYYRWEVSDIILCPSIYKITIGLGKTNFPVGRMSIEPNSGVFHANSVITFRVIADLNSVKHDRYRTTLRLIVEDLPRAAVPERFNFECKQSRNKRRLCENSVDINFEDIDVRFKCEPTVASESKCCDVDGTLDTRKTENSLQTKSMADVTRVIDDSEFWQSAFLFTPDLIDDQEISKSDHICRFIKGFGSCDCCGVTLISTAVLRPGNPLFIGITSKFSIVLCNRSSTRIKYWWSQPVGSDHSKMRIKFEPSYDSIAPNSCQVIQLKCLPFETGIISSIFIACQFDSRNPLVMSMECTVKSMCVTFYFPPIDEEDSDEYYARIEWNANEYVSKYDRKSNKIQLLSMKSREEETIHVVKLNSDRSLRKSRVEVDLFNDGEYEADFSSVDDTVNTETDKVHPENTKVNELGITPDIFKDPYDYEAESFVDENEHLRMLTHFDWYTNFIKKQFRYQPLVYEIHVHNEKPSTKRIFIKNDSPMASYFRVYVKNFWARSTIADILLDTNELQTGIELKIVPNKGEIKPHENVYFDLIVSSTTWGVYTDQITVEIDYLPPFTFWIRVINDDSPITYPICENSSIKIPNIQFTAFKAGYPLEPRKLLLENTSDVPLYVNWHCFIIEEEAEEKPFNVVLDMVSPFIDINHLLMTDSALINAIERFIRCAYNRCDSNGEIIESNDGQEAASEAKSSYCYENSQNSYSVDTQCCASEVTSSSSDFYTESDVTLVPDKLPKIEPIDTEFQVSLVPYYGKLISDLFTIEPKELFLLPRSKDYITINVNTDKLKGQPGEVRCKACGFIRIPPIFKYRDNVYHRKDGYFMTPLEIDLSCDLRRPKFFIQSDESECTFVFCTKDFLQKNTDKLRIAKKIKFANYDCKSMDLTFKIDKPFSVSRILKDTDAICGGSVTVRPDEDAQVRIKCSVNEKWIEEVRNDNEHDCHNANVMTLSKRLKIIYKEGFCQYHELYIRIIFPSLAISTTHLDFGNVMFGEQKCLQLEIRNLAKMPQAFELERTKEVKYFHIFTDKALLAGRNRRDMDRMGVTVSFIPLNPGYYKETVKVISEVDGLVFECTIEGCSCP